MASNVLCKVDLLSLKYIKVLFMIFTVEHFNSKSEISGSQLLVAVVSVESNFIFEKWFVIGFKVICVLL